MTPKPSHRGAARRLPNQCRATSPDGEACILPVGHEWPDGRPSPHVPFAESQQWEKRWGGTEESPTTTRRGAPVSDEPTFMQCIAAALACPEFLENLDRMLGTNLMRRGSPIELKIDDASGRTEHDAKLFLLCVYDLIYLRVGRKGGAGDGR